VSDSHDSIEGRPTDALSPAADGESAVLAALVAEAQRGERPAMEALLVALAPRVERFGRRLCGANSPDVDDTLQDALLAIARNLHAFEGRSALSSWVFTLVRSACAHRRRGLKNQPAIPLEALAEVGDPAPSPHEHAERRERVEAVERALLRLPVEYREVLLLRDVEGLSAAEAAATLEIGVPALKSRLHRARAMLRAALAPVFSPDQVGPDASCPDVLGALSQRLEDDLAPEACSLLEAHVRTCSACGALCDTLKGALGVCGELGREGPSPAREAELRRIVRAAVAALEP
jgi:RNA polymerase sigma-70 factor (ECF subfamily)